MKRWDVSTLGSTMLSLATGAGIPLGACRDLRVDIAGAESNCAIALAHLGRRVSWLSKVARTPLGERIVSAIESHGVDVSRVAWTDEGRNELMWVESGDESRWTTVTYDRTGASIESLGPVDVDLATIEASRYFHCTGITPALSPHCRETLREVVERARKARVRVSFDVNYRSKLWSEAEARAAISSLIEGVDLLFVGEGDLRTVWERTGDPEDELKRLQDDFGIANVILTRGAAGAAGLFGETLRGEPALAGEVASPIGAGDAFAAGVLDSLLDSDEEGCLRRGCAMAALARSSWSDYVTVGPETVGELVRSGVERSGPPAPDEKRLSR